MICVGDKMFIFCVWYSTGSLSLFCENCWNVGLYLQEW